MCWSPHCRGRNAARNIGRALAASSGVLSRRHWSCTSCISAVLSVLYSWQYRKAEWAPSTVAGRILMLLVPRCVDVLGTPPGGRCSMLPVDVEARRPLPPVWRCSTAPICRPTCCTHYVNVASLTWLRLARSLVSSLYVAMVVASLCISFCNLKLSFTVIRIVILLALVQRGWPRRRSAPHRRL